MKTRDLKPCHLCAKGMAHAGSITFFELTIQRHALDPSGIRQVHAMDVMFAGALGIGRAFCDADVSKPFGEQDRVLICEPCAISQDTTVWQLQPEPKDDDGLK